MWEEDDGGGSSDTAAARFEVQLRSYQREKIACRLKVCCILQLVREYAPLNAATRPPPSCRPCALSCAQLSSGCYPFAAPLGIGYGFGLLCALASLVGFSAAQGSQRRLLQLVRAAPAHRRHRLGRCWLQRLAMRHATPAEAW
jgi:hypothetical protein